MYKQDHWLAPL